MRRRAAGAAVPSHPRRARRPAAAPRRGSRARSAGSTRRTGWTVYRLGIEPAAASGRSAPPCTATTSAAWRGADGALGGAGPRPDRVPGRGQGPISSPASAPGWARRTRSRFSARGARGRRAADTSWCPRRSCASAPKAAGGRSRSTGARASSSPAGISIQPRRRRSPAGAGPAAAAPATERARRRRRSRPPPRRRAPLTVRRGWPIP